MRKILYIINPASGKKNASDLTRKIEQFSLDNNIDCSIVISRKNDGITDAVKKELSSKAYTDIIAVGGDGTVIEILNGIGEHAVSLGIIPMGTGNDFARSINIPQTVDEALNTIRQGITKQLDIGNVNGIKFINASGIGIDGKIISITRSIKKIIPGSLAYLISTIISVATFKAFNVKIVLDDETINESCLLIAIGNGRYFGGGMKITPQAELDNGTFQICIVKDVPKYLFLKFFLRSTMEIILKSIK
jgi:YegS/Rv2252/BmrU family lipid kinase